ncbi:MAG: type II secretion system protein [Rhodospirillaceae bacterium]
MRFHFSVHADGRGFGVIELAVAIIVLGIAFVLTLKGTTLIAPMRAFVVAQQINQYRSAVQHYQVDFRGMPGDDPGAPERFNRPPALFNAGARPLSLVGDSKIDGLFDDAGNASGEQYMAWNDLRRAGYIEGDPTLVGPSARPENIYGGVFGFAAENLGLQQVLCLTQVPGTDAELIDKRLDDANIATGRIRATSQWDPVGRKNNFPEPDAVPYDPEKTYIICLPNTP